MLLRSFLFPFFLATSLSAATRAPDFNTALEAAQVSGGHIFVYYHGSDWCRLGETLKTKIWDRPELAAALADDAILVSIDQRDGDQALMTKAAERSRPGFTPFVSPTLVSTGGAKFSRQPDGSWLFSPEGAPAKDSYEITLVNGGQPLHALVVEALADPTLPKNGPGLHSGGNFCLSQVEATIEGTPLIFSAVWADRSEKHLIADLTIDDTDSEKGSEGWSPAGNRHHRDATLVLVPEKTIPPKSRLRLTLRFSSPWAQHAIGRLKISGSSDVFLAEAVRNIHRHGVLGRVNSKAGKITRYPGVVIFDGEGRRIGAVEGLGLDSTVDTVAIALIELESMAQQRNELFTRAETADGPERANLLARGLALMREQNGFPWVDGKRGNPSRTKILADILTADPEDTNGWHRFLSFNAGALAKEANELIKEQKFDDALAKLEEQINHPLNQRLEPEQLQELHVQKFRLFRTWKEREEERFTVMEEIAAIDPTTHTGIGATGFLMMHGRGPASLTHGWLPKHVTQGAFPLVITHGVAREFDHAGPYRITINTGKGVDPLAIKSVSLLVDGKEVSSSEVNLTLQPGQLTRAECPLNLPLPLRAELSLCALTARPPLAPIRPEPSE